MTKLVHENSKYQYFFSNKEIKLLCKESKKEKILFNTKKTIRLIKKCDTKSLFYVLSSKRIILLDFSNNLVFQIKLKGDITRIKLSDNLNFLTVFENSPKRIVIIDLKNNLKIVSEKSFKELGLKLLRSYSPRIDFEIFDEMDVIAVVYMSNVHFYNLNLEKLFQMAHCYYRTFATAMEKVNRIFEEINESINNFGLPPDVYSSEKNINSALELFGFKKNYTEDELKTKFKMLIKEHHPDINPSKDSTKMSIKIIESYSILKEFKQSIPEKRTKIRLSTKKEEDKIDWFSLIKLIEGRIYFGTYSGRVIGINYERIKNILFNVTSKEGLIITDINFFQEFYFKSPLNDLNVVFNLEKDKDKIIIETSSNPFSKKEFKNTCINYKRYTEKMQ